MSNPQANPQIAIPSRAPAATTADDTVMPFEVAKLDLRGRVVRLGPPVDEILSRHAYPQPVAKLLGEALVLTVMLGSSLKIDGRFILQTQSDGPVRMLVVDFIAPDKVRACARFDKARVAGAIGSGDITRPMALAAPAQRGSIATADGSQGVAPSYVAGVGSQPVAARDPLPAVPAIPGNPCLQRARAGPSVGPAGHAWRRATTAIDTGAQSTSAW